MSAANPLSDSALQPAPMSSDDDEQALPTQPWHAPPAQLDTLNFSDSDSDSEFEFDRVDGVSVAEGFDFHDTIPAPPWLDEPADGLDLPAFPAR